MGSASRILGYRLEYRRQTKINIHGYNSQLKILLFNTKCGNCNSVTKNRIRVKRIFNSSIGEPSNKLELNLINNETEAYGKSKLPTSSNFKGGYSCQQQKEQKDNNLNSGALLICALVTYYFCCSQSATAAETLQGDAIQFFQSWLVEIEELGALGPGLFIFTVVLGEMIPLVPTQPLCLAAGLLFGSLEGAVFVLIGVSTAAVLAFSLSRQYGDSLVNRIISLEGGPRDDKEGNGLTQILSSRFEGVQQAIKSGGLWQQFVAVLFLRLTPVTPFSISNYVLGLTPLKFEAFVGGTVSGMAVWSLLYASIGGASRALLKGGEKLDALMADLSEKAAVVTEEGAGVALLLGAALLVFYYSRKQLSSSHITGTNENIVDQVRQQEMDAIQHNQTSSQSKELIEVEDKVAK